MKYGVGILIIGMALTGCEQAAQQAQNQAESTDQLDQSLSLMSTETMGEDTDILDGENDEIPDAAPRRRAEGFKKRVKHRRFRGHVRKLTRRKLIAVSGDETSTDFEKQEIAAIAAFLCHLDIKRYVANEFDTNGDGSLDSSEREDLKEARKQRRDKIKQQFDSNSDDRITRDEAKQMADRLSDARLDSILNKFDQDEDGLISRTEVDADDLPACQVPELD